MVTGQLWAAIYTLYYVHIQTKKIELQINGYEFRVTVGLISGWMLL